MAGWVNAEDGRQMNRFGGSYVLAAASGTAVIASAIVAFVLLVTVHTLNEWPLQGFGFNDGGTSSGSVGKAHVVTPAQGGHAARAAAAGAAAGATPGNASSAGAAGGGAAVVHHGTNAPGGTSVPHGGGGVSPASAPPVPANQDT